MNTIREFRGGLTRRVRDQHGMTMVELIVAASISVVITAMILLSWFALSRSYATTVKREKASDVTRLAMSRMVREIRDCEQPPATSSEVALVRARPYTIELYTTFNKAGNELADTPPRLVMYRLYANGQLWRFVDQDGVGGITGVDNAAEAWPGIDPALSSEIGAGEGAQLMASNIVNESTPDGIKPATALFTYIYYNSDGTLGRANDIRGTANRTQIRAVEMNLLIDLNPGKSPVYTHLRTTAQLRNTR